MKISWKHLFQQKPCGFTSTYRGGSENIKKTDKEMLTQSQKHITYSVYLTPSKNNEVGWNVAATVLALSVYYLPCHAS